VITAEKNCGKGAAVRMGMLASRGEIAVFTDSDLAYGCDAVCDIADALASSGSDIMIGSRAIHPEGYSGYTFARKAASKLFIRILSAGAGFSHTDSQSGIKAFSRKAADAVFPLCTVNGWAFDFETLLIAGKMGFSIEEFPVRVINHRESKVHLIRDAFRMMKDVRQIKKRVDSMKI